MFGFVRSTHLGNVLDPKSAWCALSALRESADNLVDAEKHARHAFLRNRNDPLFVQQWTQTLELQERTRKVAEGWAKMLPQMTWVAREQQREGSYSAGIGRGQG